jgi:hypothetical protein
VVHYLARHGDSRGAKAVLLIAAVPPLMVKTAANPGGLPGQLEADVSHLAIYSARVHSLASFLCCDAARAEGFHGGTPRYGDVSDTHGEDRAEARFAAMHLFVGFRNLGQRVFFNHRVHAAQQAEFQRVL